jgi:Flp pilus assembly protein TadD
MLDSAVQECRRAVDLSGRDPNVLDNLGFALLRLGNVDNALMVYDEAIGKAHIASSYMGRAIAYGSKGDSTRARADLEEAKKLDPGIENLFATYGLALGMAPSGMPKKQK